MAEPRKRLQFTAYSKDPKVIERVIDKMEGLLLNLRDTPATKRPRAMPTRYVANHLGCSVGSVKRWLVLHEGQRDTNDISNRFCDVYELIANTLSEVVSAKTFDIASDVSLPAALRAQLYLLPLMDPWTFGNRGAEDSKGSDVADIPSEVFDAMSDAERELLEQLAEQQDQLAHKVDAMLQQVAQRIARDDDRSEDP